jgi:o-succinylbenzoate synthase
MVQFRPYARSFKHPLQTCHGQWSLRQGIILRLNNERGQVGFGEIAPIPWFGSETLEQALEFCRGLPQEIDSRAIATIPATLPACQFGLESAVEMMAQCVQTWPTATNRPQLYSALLPTGAAALEAWPALWAQGFRTFKWKIGLLDGDDELRLLNQLRRALPPEGRLRLDANGGLTQAAAHAYLTTCDALAAGGWAIEFLEQPLPPQEFQAMQDLAQCYQTPLALDESVATLPHLRGYYQVGWRGVFVIKPAIAGSPARLREFCHTAALDLVFSSALETGVGRWAGLRLAAELATGDRAQGYGTAHWFSEAPIEDFEQLWQSLSPT